MDTTELTWVFMISYYKGGRTVLKTNSQGKGFEKLTNWHNLGYLLDIKPLADGSYMAELTDDRYLSMIFRKK